MSFEDVDELFYLLENPTRRRILQLLSIERLYPLQLSREIDVTQQAVVKHLRILKIIKYLLIIINKPMIYVEKRYPSLSKKKKLNLKKLKDYLIKNYLN